MIIDFGNSDENIRYGDWWQSVVNRLRIERDKELGSCQETDKFEDWLYNTWSITIIREAKWHKSPTKLEIDDEYFTLLLLRYPVPKKRIIGNVMIIRMFPMTEQTKQWAYILRCLRLDSPYKPHHQFDDRNRWLHETYGIKVRLNNSILPDNIEEFELDEQTATMLLLKYAN